MQTTVTTFLMFEGKAEEAINFYVSLIENSAITSLTRYGPGEVGAEGSVMRASFILAGQPYLCIDSPVKHGFGFTPAISLFLQSTGEDEIERLYVELSKEGQVLMPLGAYPFNRKFGWIADRFGVSWQLSLQDAAA